MEDHRGQLEEGKGFCQAWSRAPCCGGPLHEGPLNLDLVKRARPFYVLQARPTYQKPVVIKALEIPQLFAASLRM